MKNQNLGHFKPSIVLICKSEFNASDRFSTILSKVVLDLIDFADCICQLQKLLFCSTPSDNNMRESLGIDMGGKVADDHFRIQ